MVRLKNERAQLFVFPREGDNCMSFMAKVGLPFYEQPVKKINVYDTLLGFSMCLENVWQAIRVLEYF